MDNKEALMKKISQIKLPVAIPFMQKVGSNIDYIKLFSVIEAEHENCFLLESLGYESYGVRYSVIGFYPKHEIVARGWNGLEIDGQLYEVDNPYYSLRELMPEKGLGNTFAGGLVGYMSYEAVNYFEPQLGLRWHDQFSPFRFGVYLDGLIYDKMTDELWYFYYESSRIDLVQKYLEKSLMQTESNLDVRVKFLGPNVDKNTYEKNVEQVKEEILAGNTFQCEVGFKHEYEIKGNPWPLYLEMRKVNPSPYMCFIKFSQQYILGDSPELLLRKSANILESYPLAGTIGRDLDEVKDKALAAKLMSDPKEQAEHKMLVDLHRHDLGRVSRLGTVQIRSLMQIKKFSHVQHIGSEIIGILDESEDVFSAIAATYPLGTLTGAPKLESMKIIEKNEISPRGPYGGGSGIIGFNHDCALAVNIRSLFIDGNYAYTQTCSGNVYDSDAQREYAEVQKKFAAIDRVMKAYKIP